METVYPLLGYVRFSTAGSQKPADLGPVIITFMKVKSKESSLQSSCNYPVALLNGDGLQQPANGFLLSTGRFNLKP